MTIEISKDMGSELRVTKYPDDYSSDEWSIFQSTLGIYAQKDGEYVVLEINRREKGFSLELATDEWITVLPDWIIEDEEDIEDGEFSGGAHIVLQNISELKNVLKKEFSLDFPKEAEAFILG